jgi:hypothetical protein
MACTVKLIVWKVSDLAKTVRASHVRPYPLGQLTCLKKPAITLARYYNSFASVLE